MKDKKKKKSELLNKLNGQFTHETLGLTDSALIGLRKAQRSLFILTTMEHDAATKFSDITGLDTDDLRLLTNSVVTLNRLVADVQALRKTKLQQAVDLEESLDPFDYKKIKFEPLLKRDILK